VIVLFVTIKNMEQGDYSSQWSFLYQSGARPDDAKVQRLAERPQDGLNPRGRSVDGMEVSHACKE
jgi:hypothetical protein